MYINMNGADYELSTRLGTAMKIEKKFGGKSILQIFDRLGEADTNDLVSIVVLAAGKEGDRQFYSELVDSWDLVELLNTVQKLIAGLMFSGSPEQTGARIDKFPGTEAQKNGIRELLGVAVPVNLTGKA